MTTTTVRSVVLFMALSMALGIGIIAFFPDTGNDLFMSHAHCYLFNKKLIMLHGGSDMVIGLSYVAISFTLVYLVFRSRKELSFHWMMLAFSVFIVACGMTHFMEVWTLEAEHPKYWISGWMKFLTAVASMVTAVLLPPLVPKIRAVLQSARLAKERKTELEAANAALSELYQKAISTPASKLAAAGESSDEPDRDADGRPPDLAVMAKEVTLHANEMERAKQEAEAANLAKDQFLAVLSHELRTPLTPALAAASSLEHATEFNPQELRESLAMIRRNIELEARLVDDVLDLARISKGKLEVHLSTVDLNETIQHAVEMCRSISFHKRTELSLCLDATEHYVHGDGARLAQVFWNLMLNAVKFTPADGRIVISTSNPAPGSVRINVSDNGIGIESEMLLRIFDPFQQGEHTVGRRFGGMGLGLSIAKALVEAHNGTITVRSGGKGQGSTFFVDLATIEAPTSVKTSGEAVLEPIRRSIRILLVEDHVDTRNALTRLITKWGHVVKSADTIKEALEIADTFQPELIISDIGLPDGTGIELLGKLHETSKVPAIAMSGYGMESDLAQTKEAGFVAHLVKPVSAERLKETVDRLFA